MATTADRLSERIDESFHELLGGAIPNDSRFSLGVYDRLGNVQWRSQPESGRWAPDTISDTLLLKLQLSENSGAELETDSDGHGRVFAMPLRQREEILGYALGFVEHDEGGLSDTVKAYLRHWVRLSELHFEHNRTITQLTEELSARYEEIHLMHSLSETLDLSHGYEAGSKILFDVMEEHLHADFCIVNVPELGVYQASKGDVINPHRWRAIQQAIHDEIKKAHDSVVINDLSVNELFASHTEQFSSMAATPIGVGGCIGVLAFFRSSKELPVMVGDLKLLDLIARQLSTFLSNKKLQESREKVIDTTIFALARLVECRDDDTGSHLDRVANYCLILATQLSAMDQYADVIDQSFIDDIFRTSSLHDIGKVGIPDSILMKPGPLTEEELEVMKMHTLMGGDAIHDIELRYGNGDCQFLGMGKRIAYCHHERWDGSGYPRNLKGDEIPLEARILAVADVFDALISERPYKKPLSYEDARGIVIEGRGSQFDPDVVDAFEATYTRLVEVHKRSKAEWITCDRQ